MVWPPAGAQARKQALDRSFGSRASPQVERRAEEPDAGGMARVSGALGSEIRSQSPIGRRTRPRRSSREVRRAVVRCPYWMPVSSSTASRLTSLFRLVPSAPWRDWRPKELSGLDLPCAGDVPRERKLWSYTPAVVCKRCGQENPLGARFCLACGAPLEAEPAKQERKLVSVLFVDLVGFTGQSERADPEDVRDTLNAYRAAAQESIQVFGGNMEKFIGDAVMAVFGAPVSHGDDAERAVRAGLGVLEAVARLKLIARGGVNTGEAVVTVASGRATGEALAMGDVVNTASRLQTSAPPGGLVVGEETYRLTRNAIKYQALPSVDAKGKQALIPAWQSSLCDWR